MASFSLNPLRSREPKSKLPVYERFEGKERDSNDSYDDSDYDSDATSSPSTSNSRHTSASVSATPLMARKTLSLPRRPGRPLGYRLPNKVVRYLCFGLVSTILLLIFSLVRASRNENHRLVNGLVMKRPPPPPVWESYPFLTRYYGGIRNLVSFQRNVPEYPRPEDELPIDKLAFVNFTHSDDPAEPEKRDIPPSKVFVDHPKSVFKMSPEAISECFLDPQKKLRVPPIRYYEGRPNGFPEPAVGSYELLNINEDICYERYGRYGPYGLGYSQRRGGLGIGEHGERQGAESTWEKVPQVDWRVMNWADAQRRCFQANADRYKPLPKRVPPPHGYFVDDASVSSTLLARDAPQEPVAAGQKPQVEAPKGAAADEKLNVDAFKGTPAEEKTKAEASKAAAADERLKAEAPKGAAADEKLKADAAKGAASEDQPKGDATKSKAVDKLPRTAVVVRCWDEFWFRQEDIMNVRSLITELSLASGGRYDVHLLVQVKNDAMYPIWADAETYERRIRDRIPAEFQGLVTLWTETQMLSLYQGIYDVYARGPDLPVHGVYRGLSMALQHFAYQHPEYDYYWQWEMDIRYTGHYYDLFSKVENWAKEQPRKGLWERGGRFYVPSIHGTWEDFKQMARVQTEMGTAGADNIWAGVPKGKKTKPPAPTRGGHFVWGPERPKEEGDWFEPDSDPVPPTVMDRDKYVWGVGEDADYITFNPMFDPEGTTWGLADDITGYNTTREKPPRRANIITASRLSRRLLMTMHRETAFKKHFAFPEMWPATAALHHGYKAVYVPHPLYIDREWPTAVLAQTLNNGKDGATGGSRTSVFGDREHNLRGLSWFYDSGFSPNLYRRWLGLKVNNDGGEEFELTPDPSKDGTTVGKMRGGEGRMCLPPVLLHPVKDVDLPVEELINDDAEVPESDPAA